MMLSSMGYTERQVQGALKATNNSVERAAEDFDFVHYNTWQPFDHVVEQRPSEKDRCLAHLSFCLSEAFYPWKCPPQANTNLYP